MSKLSSSQSHKLCIIQLRLFVYSFRVRSFLTLLPSLAIDLAINKFRETWISSLNPNNEPKIRLSWLASRWIWIFHSCSSFFFSRGKLNYAKEKIIILEGTTRKEFLAHLVEPAGKQKDVAWIIYARHLSRNENARARKHLPPSPARLQLNFISFIFF